MAAGRALSPRARLLLAVFLLALVALGVQRWISGRPRGPLHEFRGSTMGTSYSVQVVASALHRRERERISEAIALRLDRIDRLMSTWKPDSELSRFNRLGPEIRFPVARETLEVFRVAQAVAERSGGALDVTVGPLVEAWGFGASDRVPEPPSEEELAALRQRVGYRRVHVDLGSSTLSKTGVGTVCDLSAVAKGFAVDQVADGLAELGYSDFLVEVGGEVAARGRRPDATRWRVAIETPDPRGREVYRVVPLEDRAMATSGDYRNFYERDGVWLSHLIDPRSARPIEHGLASVSVVHSDAVRADAWATALIVLGPEEGYALAEREGLAAFFIVRETDGGYRARASSAFRALGAAGPGPSEGLN